MWIVSKKSMKVCLCMSACDKDNGPYYWWMAPQLTDVLKQAKQKWQEEYHAFPECGKEGWERQNEMQIMACTLIENGSTA